MLIELAFIACMHTAVETCREEYIRSNEGTLMGCLIGAQAELAQWTNRHAEWQIKSYKCHYVDETAQKT